MIVHDFLTKVVMNTWDNSEFPIFSNMIRLLLVWISLATWDYPCVIQNNLHKKIALNVIIFLATVCIKIVYFLYQNNACDICLCQILTSWWLHLKFEVVSLILMRLTCTIFYDKSYQVHSTTTYTSSFNLELTKWENTVYMGNIVFDDQIMNCYVQYQSGNKLCRLQ